MKYIYLLVLSLLIIKPGGAQAQTFTVPHDTVYVPNFSTVPLAQPHDDLKNITGNNLTIRWHVVACDLPADWLLAAAFGICDDSTCKNNTGNVVWNSGTSSGSMFTAHYYANATHDSVGSFSLALDFTSATTVGCHYVTVNLSDFIGGYSKDITFKVCKLPAQIPSLAKTSGTDFSVYPNPANNELNVVFDAYNDVHNIAVYNFIGRVMNVYKVTGNSANLDIQGIPAGIYFIRLLNSFGDAVVTSKFTKQ
jgi:Secretion system C-terminal sorting domain